MQESKLSREERIEFFRLQGNEPELKSLCIRSAGNDLQQGLNKTKSLLNILKLSLTSNKYLETLTLDGAVIDSTNAKLIKQIIANNPNIKNISFKNVFFDRDAAHILGKGLQETESLDKITIDGEHPESDSAIIVANYAAQNQRITKFSLHNIAEHKRFTIRRLYDELVNNILTSENLQKVNLSGNKFLKNVDFSVSGFLSKTKISELDLSNNKIDVSKLLSILNLLKRIKSIKRLNLNTNQIEASVSGLIPCIIRNELKATGVTEINLKGNKLNAYEVDVLKEAMEDEKHPLKTAKLDPVLKYYDPLFDTNTDSDCDFDLYDSFKDQSCVYDEASSHQASAACSSNDTPEYPESDPDYSEYAAGSNNSANSMVF